MKPFGRADSVISLWDHEGFAKGVSERHLQLGHEGSDPSKRKYDVGGKYEFPKLRGHSAVPV